MSKIKRSLPEDIDITDPRDPGFPDPEPHHFVDEPGEVDNAVYEISKGVGVLKKNREQTKPYRKELKKLSTDLEQIAENQ